MQVNTIAEQLFFTTVRIDTTNANGALGAGTGFFFSHRIGEITYPFIVTNKHVVLNMREGRFTFVKLAGELPAIGDGYTLNIPPEEWGKIWYGHPDPEIGTCQEFCVPGSRFVVN